MKKQTTSNNISNIKIKIVRTLDELLVHANQWNQLALQAPQQLPMLSYAWIAAYFEHRVKSDEFWRCFLAYDGEQLVGVLPLIVTPRRTLGLKSVILRTPYDNHTVSVDLLALPGREHEIIPEIIKSAMNEYPRWFSFEFKRLPDTSPTLRVLLNDNKTIIPVKEYDGIGDYLAVEGDYEKYWKDLSSSTRRNLRNRERKLERLTRGEPAFIIEDSASEKELSLFMKVEAAGWKARTGSAILNSPPLVSFYNNLTCHLAAPGWLEWQFLQAGGKTYAANLSIKFNRSLVIWKLGYDETYSNCAPGSLLFERVIQHAFESGKVDEINLLTDMPWHKQWKTKKRNYYNLYLYPKRPIPLLLGAFPRKLLIFLRRVPGLRSGYNYLRTLLKRNTS